jgi:glycerol-3-phosphate acyltransferase PlsY
MLDIPTAQGGLTKFASMAMGLIVVSRHKANIYRILEGTEPRFKLPEALTKKTEASIESAKE